MHDRTMQLFMRFYIYFLTSLQYSVRSRLGNNDINKGISFFTMVEIFFLMTNFNLYLYDLEIVFDPEEIVFQTWTKIACFKNFKTIIKQLKF
jgi:hypothetical protein